MDNIELQKLRDLPIEGVAERLGLSVSRHKALCPFHDDHHASLSFNRAKNTFRCFVCGAHGDAIDLVMRYLSKDFIAACRWLADANNIIIAEHKATTNEYHRPQFDAKRYVRFFERPWLSDAAREFLFDVRKLDERVIRWCRLTSWRDREGLEWLQIPYYDTEGTLIGIQNRNLTKQPMAGDSNTAQPRFRFPYGSRCTIYNLPVLTMLRNDEPLFITEGCSDCWAMLSSGHKAVAIPSATLLNPNDVRLLTRPLQHGWHGTYHMFPDRDEPGERLFLQLKSVLPNLQHHHLPPNCKDYSDYYISMVMGTVDSA